MPGTIDQTTIATEIKQVAAKYGIWALSFEQTGRGGSSRVWWLKRSGEELFVQRDLTNREAVALLRHEDWEGLRKLRLYV